MLKSILALTISSFAASAALAQPDSPGGQPYWIEQAKALAQLQGITVGEAVRRHRLQIVAERQNQRFANDPNYVGARFNRPGSPLAVEYFFSRGSGNKYISDPELAAISSIKELPLSLGEMNRQRVALQTASREAGVKVSVGMKPIEQQMLVYPENPQRFAELVENGTIKIPSFAIVQSGPLKYQPEAEQLAGGLMTGLRTTNNYTYRCVGGFAVTNGSTTGIATAGHCEDLPEWDLRTFRGRAVGTMRGERDHVDGLDVAWFRNDADTYPAVIGTSAGNYPIKAVAPQIPGQWKPVCVVRKDNTQACAYTHTHFYFASGSGPYVSLDRDELTVVGDSGGPWFYVDTAYGIHSGNVDWDGRTRDFYSPAANLPRMGISVITQ